jgi:hypothetical protein
MLKVSCAINPMSYSYFASHATQKLSRFDAHAKASDGIQIKTLGGACVSVTAAVGT